MLTVAYSTGIVVLFPFVHLEQLANFTQFHVMLFVVSVFLTLSSYLFFAEALRHLEASRTGVIVPHAAFNCRHRRPGRTLYRRDRNRKAQCFGALWRSRGSGRIDLRIAGTKIE